LPAKSKSSPPKKSARIQIRLTDLEKNELTTEATELDLTLSEYLRSKVVVKRTKELKEHDEKVLALQLKNARDFGRVHGLLNQVAKWANSYKSDADAKIVVSQLTRIEEILNNDR
jgi:outer membrane PBP1 activator LpoA protein